MTGEGGLDRDLGGLGVTNLADEEHIEEWYVQRFMKLCDTVFITKLPFAPPSEPVDEARAEWLRSVGRPAAGHS